MKSLDWWLWLWVIIYHYLSFNLLFKGMACRQWQICSVWCDVQADVDLVISVISNSRQMPLISYMNMRKPLTWKQQSPASCHVITSSSPITRFWYPEECVNVCVMLPVTCVTQRHTKDRNQRKPAEIVLTCNAVSCKRYDVTTLPNIKNVWMLFVRSGVLGQCDFNNVENVAKVAAVHSIQCRYEWVSVNMKVQKSAYSLSRFDLGQINLKKQNKTKNNVLCLHLTTTVVYIKFVLNHI